jgi:hypothetical protein
MGMDESVCLRSLLWRLVNEYLSRAPSLESLSCEPTLNSHQGARRYGIEEPHWVAYGQARARPGVSRNSCFGRSLRPLWILNQPGTCHTRVATPVLDARIFP